MPEAHRKAWKPSEAKSPLEDVRVLPDHIFGKIDGFEVDFKKGGEVEARRSYRNVEVTIKSQNSSSDKKMLLEKLDIAAVYMLKPLFSDCIIESKEVRAEFRPDDVKRTVFGSVARTYGDSREEACFSERFTAMFYKDLGSLRRKLEYVLKFDSRLSSAFGAEIESKERLEKFVVELADEAERISERSDVKKNPLTLLPVLNRAKEKGIVMDVLMELSVRSMNHDERAQQYGRLIDALQGLKERSEKEEK